jgi:predicted kinase
MKQPYIVVFAGAPGSSKSIVSHYVSMEFSLPILNRDTIRSEVKEELLVSNINEPHALVEFEQRFTDRWEEALALGESFILDGSVDRSWPYTKQELQAAGFCWFMIDMELSREFFTELFTATKRPKSIGQLDMYLGQHEAFMSKYRADVNIEINDAAFPRRCELAAEGLASFLAR